MHCTLHAMWLDAGARQVCKPVCVCVLCVPLGTSAGRKGILFSPVRLIVWAFRLKQLREDLWMFSSFSETSVLLCKMISQHTLYSCTLIISLLSHLRLVLIDNAIWPVSVLPLTGAEPGDGGQWYCKCQN